MKRAIVLLTIMLTLLLIVINITTNVYAAEENSVVNQVTSSNGNLVELKKEQAKTLDEYKAKYGSDSYGFTAYILHMVQVYSIPFCFLGIVISIIYRVVIGARHMENVEKGLGMMVAIITVTVICQVLPLVFAIVVKVGRE